MAVALVDGKEVKDEYLIEYQTEKWSKPTHFDIKEVPIDDTYSWVKIQARDENNVRCLDATNRVRFSAAGDAKLIEKLGTVDGSGTVELCNGAAKIKIKKVGSEYSVAVQSEGIETVMLK